MIDLQNLNKKKIIFIVLIAVAIFYLDCAYLLRAQLNTLKNKGQKLSKLQEDIRGLNKDLTMMQQMQNKTKDAGRIRRIAREEEIPLVLQDTSDIAQKNNVKLVQIKPLKEVRPQPQDSTAASFSLDLICDYHNFGRFLNALEELDTVISVEEMKIMGNPKDYFQQKVNLGLKIYVKN